MGFRFFVEINALQGNMTLEAYEEEGRLWKSVVKALWEIVDVGGSYRDVARPHGIGLWRKIGMGKQKFHECINWKLRKGGQNLFLVG